MATHDATAKLAGEGNLTAKKTTLITTSIKRNLWWILLYVAIEMAGAGIGAFLLTGWVGFGFALVVDVVTFIIGVYTVWRVYREVTL